MATKKPNHKKTDKLLFSKSRFSKPALLVFVLIFAGVGAYILLRSLAAPAPPTVYLSPATQTVGSLTNFSVQVRENSGTTAVNAIQANLTYNSTLVDFVSIDTTGTAFSVEAQSTGGSGTINMARGTCGGCAAVTGDQLVATINFKSKSATGAAAVAFATGTALVSSSTNTDILGSLAATAGGTYTVDTTGPSVSLTAPSNGATLAQGSTVSVTASASDSTSSVSKVEFYIDGNLAATDTSTPYSYSWNTTGLALGSHTIQAKAYDAVNNVTATPVNTVNLTDQTAPSAPGSLRSTGSTQTTISLAWNASTDNVGVSSYKLSRGGTLIATLPAGTLTYNDSGLTAGTSYTYSIVAVDAAGNTSTATTLTTSSMAQLPGDANNDGHVTIVDLSILLANWGTSNTSCDFNHDGLININDLSILLSHYGT